MPPVPSPARIRALLLGLSLACGASSNAKRPPAVSGGKGGGDKERSAAEKKQRDAHKGGAHGGAHGKGDKGRSASTSPMPREAGRAARDAKGSKDDWQKANRQLSTTKKLERRPSTTKLDVAPPASPRNLSC